jgi:hypothetical protein
MVEVVEHLLSKHEPEVQTPVTTPPKKHFLCLCIGRAFSTMDFQYEKRWTKCLSYT